MKIPRPILASLLAPVAALLPIFAISAYELSQGPALINGEPDDAPQRAFGVLLGMLPVIYVALALMAHVLAALFIRLGLRTMRSFLLGSGLFAVLLAVPSALGPGFSVEDGLISFLVFSLAFSSAAIPGAACWFLIAMGSQQAHSTGDGERAV